MTASTHDPANWIKCPRCCGSVYAPTANGICARCNIIVFPSGASAPANLSFAVDGATRPCCPKCGSDQIVASALRKIVTRATFSNDHDRTLIAIREIAEKAVGWTSIGDEMFTPEEQAQHDAMEIADAAATPPPPDAPEPLTAQEELAQVLKYISEMPCSAAVELRAFRAVCRVCGVAGAAELGAEVERLRAALVLARPFIRHMNLCSERHREGCDCGAAKARQAVDTALASVPQAAGTQEERSGR